MSDPVSENQEPSVELLDKIAREVVDELSRVGLKAEEYRRILFDIWKKHGCMGMPSFQLDRKIYSLWTSERRSPDKHAQY